MLSRAIAANAAVRGTGTGDQPQQCPSLCVGFSWPAGHQPQGRNRIEAWSLQTGEPVLHMTTSYTSLLPLFAAAPTATCKLNRV